MAYTMRIKVDEGTGRVLRRNCRRYEIPMGALIEIAMRSVLNWDKLVKAYFNICPDCALANNVDVVMCRECGSLLIKGAYVPSEIFGSDNEIMMNSGLYE